MNTYAEYLNTMTVKALHSIAKQMGARRYSKLRKAELVAFINGEVEIACDMADQMVKPVKAAPVVEFSFPAANGEVVTEKHAKICADKGHAKHTVDGTDSGVCPRCGESTVKAPQSPAKTMNSVAAQEDTLEELVSAYRAMRRTMHSLGNTPTRVKIVVRLRAMRSQIASMGMNLRTL